MGSEDVDRGIADRGDVGPREQLGASADEILLRCPADLKDTNIVDTARDDRRRSGGSRVSLSARARRVRCP